MASSQVVKFRTNGGDVAGRSNAIVLAESDVVSMAQANSSLPAGLFVGIGYRETSLAANEIDIEPSGVTTYGYLQLGNDGVGGPQDLDATQCTIDGDKIFSGYLSQIMSAAGLDSPTRDCYAYVCWAHNAGIGEALTSIQKYGLDWQATIDRNNAAYSAGGDTGAAYMVTRMIPYANAVLGYVDQYGEGSSSSGGDDSSSGGDTMGLVLILAGATVLFWAMT